MKVNFATMRLSVIPLLIVLLIIAVSCGDDGEPAPETAVISSFTPTSALPGATVTITGKNFSSTATGNVVSFNGVSATVTSATETTLVVAVPEGATAGPISVTVDGVTATSSASFTPLNTSITSFSPESGVAGTAVTISGTNFGATASENTVEFNGVEAEVTAATATSLTVTVPAEATSGKITVTILGKSTASVKDFTVSQPEITGTFPGIAAEGISVTISGANFSPVAEYNIVEFNGVEATVTSVSETELTVLVPAGATTGPLSVKVGSHTTATENDFEICNGGPELVISNAVASLTEITTSYSASFTITNVGSEDADLTKVLLQNYASVDADGISTAAAGGFLLTSAPVLAPGESFETGNYGASIVGGNTTSHPYLVITLSDSPDGAVPECNVDNNVLVVPFE